MKKGQSKVSDKRIIAAYEATKSVWAAGKIVGLCGQSVHERCVKLGIIKANWFSDYEISQIKKFYIEGFRRGDGQLDLLAEELNRTKHTICRKARKMGMTNRNRADSQAIISKRADRSRRWFKENEHPKGMLGKSHSIETRDRMSKSGLRRYSVMTQEERAANSLRMLRTKASNGNLYIPRPKTSWKAGWRKIGARRKYYRSRWEANYARYLELLRANGEIKKWEHEPETFWFEKIKRGTRSYLPDFRVIENDGTVTYHEVKGWMDDRSRTKLKRMKKYYPGITIILIQRKQYRDIERKLGSVIKGWE